MSLTQHPDTGQRPVTDEPPYDPDYDRPPVNGHAGGRDNPSAPQADREAEQAVLATLIEHPDAGETLRTPLEPDDFYWPVHQHIWTTWHHLADTSPAPPDRVLLNAALRAARDTDALRLVADLVTFPTIPAHLDG